MTELEQKRPPGRSLRLFLAEGTATGVINAQLGMSSLLAACASRVALPSLVARQEAGETGIYLLVGPDPSSPGSEMVYVGEGDQVRTRLIAHDKDPDKDFFSRCVLIVSKDANLTKAHARYLEAKLISILKRAGRCRVVNGTEPPTNRRLPEADVADMEIVLQEIELLLSVLGFDLLRAPGHSALESTVIGSVPTSVDSTSPGQNEFMFSRAGTEARARESEGEFVVLKGSIASAVETETCPQGVRLEREQLRKSGALLPLDSNRLKFMRDVGFSSTTRAGAVIYGGSVSGPQHWRHAITNQTYGAWREARLDDEIRSFPVKVTNDDAQTH
jgi:hypothetical protein